MINSRDTTKSSGIVITLQPPEGVLKELVEPLRTGALYPETSPPAGGIRSVVVGNKIAQGKFAAR